MNSLSNEVLSLPDFNSMAEKKLIFKSMSSFNPSRVRSIADYWTSFSYMMPKLLIRASYNLERLNERETLQAIAKEERGEDSGTPHFKMFEDACKMIGLESEIKELDILKDLMKFGVKSNNNETLGLCFGLEVIANENIEFLFQNLCSDENEKSILSQSEFFILHRQNEDQHIEMNYNNYLKFCRTKEDQENFMIGYDYALNFWKLFWSQATLTRSEPYELIS